MPYGSTESFWRIGSANAIVFPEPVFALPMQSLPGNLNMSDKALDFGEFLLALQKRWNARRLNLRRCAYRHLRQCVQQGR